MNLHTLFLAWQDKGRTEAWFPVGRLDADVGRSSYRFRYIGGAKRAQQEAGFPLLVDFPQLNGDYRSRVLFPLFSNRIMSPRRPDFTDYLRNLDLSEQANPIEILSANGGHRATDAYEVFPKLEKHPDGGFVCRFFLHGLSHINPAARERIAYLSQGEELYVTLELTNPATRVAVQIQTTDYHMLGWAPRYLVHDLTKAMVESPTKYKAKVVQINSDAPLKHQVLVEMQNHWKEHQPMTDKDFIPLVGNEAN